MDEFYGRIGSVLKHSYEGYTAWILSGDMVSLKKVALKPFRKFDLLNGDIECRFQGYELYGGTRKTEMFPAPETGFVTTVATKFKKRLSYPK